MCKVLSPSIPSHVRREKEEHGRMASYRRSLLHKRQTKITAYIKDLGERGRTKPGAESHSQLGAVRPKTIVSTMTATTIGTWNVQTVYKCRKTVQVAAKKIRKLNLINIGISESRFQTGSRPKRSTLS
ncbi:hypothetical protein DPMN_101263 [Dreissena polymorpha]|uniref:Uncharacterized protein n=1 Tax=Dreissena polymorpha TaxID=45954 RepID=A0A9D4LH98_DREPO|nr:hypothetical protein DPMN_101263 [Dreissena polymorpha]